MPRELPASHLTDIGHQICIQRIQDMELRLELVEHLLNQQSTLAGTLGDIMEVLKSQER